MLLSMYKPSYQVARLQYRLAASQFDLGPNISWVCHGSKAKYVWAVKNMMSFIVTDTFLRMFTAKFYMENSCGHI